MKRFRKTKLKALINREEHLKRQYLEANKETQEYIDAILDNRRKRRSDYGMGKIPKRVSKG